MVSRLHIAFSFASLFPSAAQIFTLFTTPRPDPEYPLSAYLPAPHQIITFPLPSLPRLESSRAFLWQGLSAPKSRPVNSQHTHFLRRPHLSNFTFFILHDPPTFPVIPSTRFPLPSIASTSRFYWEFLVYIIDQIKQKEKHKTENILLILRLSS